MFFSSTTVGAKDTWAPNNHQSFTYLGVNTSNLSAPTSPDRKYTKLMNILNERVNAGENSGKFRNFWQ